MKDKILRAWPNPFQTQKKLDQYLAEIFSLPSLVAYKGKDNILIANLTLLLQDQKYSYMESIETFIWKVSVFDSSFNSLEEDGIGF